MGFVLFIVLAVLVVGGISFARLRRGGPGPALGYVPRRWRPALDRWYTRRGYSEPYDADGERRRDRSLQ